MMQIKEKKEQKRLLEEEIKKRMFRARNREPLRTRLDCHGQSVDEVLRMLSQMLEHLKHHPLPGVHRQPYAPVPKLRLTDSMMD